MRNLLLIIILLTTFFCDIDAQKNILGKKFIDAKLYDADGNIHYISDYKGKTIILTFIGASTTNALEISDFYHFLFSNNEQDYVLLSISCEDYTQWCNTIKINPLPWPCFNDKKELSGIFLDYGFKNSPNCIVISPEGIVINRYQNYDITLAQTLAKRYTTISSTKKTIVERPLYKKNNMFIPEHIEQISYNQDITEITLSTYSFNSIKISKVFTKGIHLLCDDGTECHLIKNDVQNIENNIGKTIFTIKFEPIPESTKRIKIISDDGTVIISDIEL